MKTPPWAVCRAQKRECLNLTARKNLKKFFVPQSSLEQREGEKKEIIYLMKIHNSCEGFALK